jgi:hypothetical protein
MYDEGRWESSSACRSAAEDEAEAAGVWLVEEDEREREESRTPDRMAIPIVPQPMMESVYPDMMGGD